MNLPTLILVLSLVFTGYGYESNYEQNEDTWAMDRAWNSMTEEQQYNAPIEYQANAVRMTVDEFMFMAAVVQAESDGTGSWTSCEAVAVCIFDRVYDPRFPDTVTKVLNEPGQFSTVVNGTSIKSATKDSRWGVILGYKAVYSGKYPTNLLYFNCIGYNYGYAYDYIGGNYFMTA